jgi:hypothetical protein
MRLYIYLIFNIFGLLAQRVNLFLHINDGNIKISVSKKQLFFTMFKKKSVNLLFVTMMVMLSGVSVVYAQDSLNIGLDSVKSTLVNAKESDSVPFFTVDSLYNSLLDDALNIQCSVDSMDETIFQYRRKIIYIDDTYEKIKMQRQVVRLEEEVKILQTKADSLFLVMDEMTRPEATVHKNSLLILDTVIEGIKVYHYNLEEWKSIQAQMKEGDIAGKEKISNFFQSDPDNQFSIQKQTPYSSDHPFEYDFQVPHGVFYRIQLGAFSKEVKYDYFGGINPITTQPVEDGKIVRYFAGKFTNYPEAEYACSRVRAAGFRDAFLVGYYNGQRMSVDRVREFEKIRH